MDIREGFWAAVNDSASGLAQMIRDLHQGALEAALPEHKHLWDVLTPKYSPGCKRVVISDDFFPTLGSATASLETRAIAKVTPTGLVYADGTEAQFDLLVLATGFRTLDFLHPIAVTGARGTRLTDVWARGAAAHRGTTVPHMPNLGLLYGPNTNLGHNSIILMIEAQSRYLAALAAPVLEARAQGVGLAVAPKEDVAGKYNERVQSALRVSSFADANCQSWYKNKEGKITNNWSGTVVQYQEELSEVLWGEFEAEGPGRELVEEKGERSALGRVVEETRVSNTAMLASAAGVLAVGAGWALRGRLLRGR